MVTPRSTATWPSSACSSPVISRNSVDLPAPLGPTSPVFSPFWSAAEASMKRIWWPCCLLTLSRRIMRDWDLEGFAAALSHMTRERHPYDTETGPANVIASIALRSCGLWCPRLRPQRLATCYDRAPGALSSCVQSRSESVMSAPASDTHENRLAQETSP